MNGPFSYARVLIIGQSFSKSNGGGITLINLFRGWPLNSLAVVTIGHYMENLDPTVCTQYYCLGNSNQKKIFPLNLIQRKFPSGPFPITTDAGNKVNTYASKEKKLRNFVVMKMLYPFLEWTGLFHIASRISPDQQLYGWIAQFQPQYLYSQLSSLEWIYFMGVLSHKLKIPYVIHIMDDWPTTIVKRGIFSFYWKNRIDTAFREILVSAFAKLTISEAMKSEYERRYGGTWEWFCNPIELGQWLPFRRQTRNINGTVKIGYTGRLGIGTLQSLRLMEDAMGVVGREGYDCELHVYTPDNKTLDAANLEKNTRIKIHAAIPHSEMPQALSKFDILFLPLDFDQSALKFVRFSLPTKASEFMISGVPILVFASPETGLVKYAEKEKWGFTVTSGKSGQLAEGLRTLLRDKMLRDTLTENAESTARHNHDAVVVRERFRSVFFTN